MTEFKFLRQSEDRINWQLTGLLDGANNVELLTRVLNLTYDYIQDNNLNNNETVRDILFISMTKLYSNKNYSYCNDSIRGRIIDIFSFLCGPEASRIVQEIQSNAWTTIDIDAELTHIIFEQNQWEEDEII